MLAITLALALALALARKENPALGSMATRMKVMKMRNEEKAVAMRGQRALSLPF